MQRLIGVYRDHLVEELWDSRMFITDQIPPSDMLAELLSLRLANEKMTSKFQRLRHNRDLCPGFANSIDVMLDAYRRYGIDVQNTQGPRDNGVDILLKYDFGQPYRAGLQIKSHFEIEKWKAGRDKNFMLTLKAQFSAATQNARVDDYYLLLCTDSISHKNQIMNICSEFAQYDKLKVISPVKCLSLFELSNLRIDIAVTRMLCKRDLVLAEAQEEVEDLSRDTLHMLINIICLAFEGQTIFSQEQTIDMAEDSIDASGCGINHGNRVVDIIDELSQFGFSMPDDQFKTIVEELPLGLCGLYFEQRIKNSGIIRDYMFELLTFSTRKIA